MDVAEDFLSGCVGGFAGVIVGHPFDTVKVRIQTQDANNRIYKGVFHTFYKILVNERIAGLYKGVTSPLFGLSFINAIVFGVQGSVQKRLPEPDSLTSVFIAGSTAGFFQTFICSPTEYAKTQMQMQNQGKQGKVLKTRTFAGPIDFLREKYALHGIRGPFKGLSITLWREVPALGIYFTSYEVLRMKMFPSMDDEHYIKVLLAGGFAGIISWVVLYPIDVVKSRFQADGHDGHIKYHSIRDCIKKSYRAEGLRCFTRGLNSTIVRAMPTNAATFLFVTYTKKLIRYEMEYEDIPETEIDIVFKKTGAELLW